MTALLQSRSVRLPRSARRGEIASRVQFSQIRYAQCWEDADVLLEALDPQPGSVCLSVSSAGDNTLALLALQPARVIAVDLNPAQLACLELRIAAYRELDHAELLELVGSRPSQRRAALYRCCRRQLSASVRAFWDSHLPQIALGIGSAGKFERYFAIFRKHILPWVHSPAKVEQLFYPRSSEEREHFYRSQWDTWRWRLMFRLFFSRFVMGRLGRDPELFRYVQGSVAGRLLGRARHALTLLEPAANPYLQWILTGGHTTALPFALRPENFEPIRQNLERLESHCCSLEKFLDDAAERSIDCFNLSDVFEYISTENYHLLLEQIMRAGQPGARVAYWNMLADRSRPDCWSGRLRSLGELSRRLHAQDKAFFYSRFVVEEII